MADDAQRLKTITDQIQRTYESLRRAAANISGLIQVGRATCDQVRAYNLWAIAVWNTQRGMLASLRAAGNPNVPPDPPQPTLFAWRGVSGAEAFRVNCAGEAKSLSGALRDAMKPPTPTTQYLGPNEIEIVTSDPNVMNPDAMPSFAELVKQQEQQAGLGLPTAVLIVIGIAAIAVVAIAIPAVMSYLKSSDVQENNTKQVALQAEAYANYTAAMLECFKRCGAGDEGCIERCRKSVLAPDIKLPGQGEKWGWLQWTGFTVVAGVGAMIAWRIYQRKVEGKPVFQLPESVEAAISR